MNPTARATLIGGGLLAACALLAALLLTGTERLTRERIAEARRQTELNALSAVLPPSLYDNDPLSDRISVIAPAWLGSERPLSVRRARRNGAPAGLAIEAIAPDGYSGPIRLLVGIDHAGRVIGVRIVEHQETPGLGDAIEADRSDWIERFHGRSLGDPPASRWTVRKHGGAFDQFSGATITPRAVTVAVRRVLEYAELHADMLYAAEDGAIIDNRAAARAANVSAATPAAAPPPTDPMPE